MALSIFALFDITMHVTADLHELVIIRVDDKCRVSARQPSYFCFGKSSQNHVGRDVALQVPCAVRRLRRRANSLRSNNARLFSGAGCTARPHHKAREDCGNNESLIMEGKSF